jgi:hypothetical protein
MMGSMITLAMVNRNMKPPSSTMGESGDGSVANTRRRREVELNGCGEWMTLQIGGGKGDDVVVFSEGFGASNRVGTRGKLSKDAGLEITQMSRGSRLQRVCQRNNHMKIKLPSSPAG